MVGETMPTAAGLRIERGKVEEFARAIGDTSAVYRDPAVARERGLSDVPAPLTFTRTADFPRYRPEEYVAPYGFDLGFALEATLHGRQGYEFHRPAVAGDVLSATATVTDVYRRSGERAGEMVFADIEQAFEDEDGEPVVTVTTTAVEIENARDLETETETDPGAIPDDGALLREDVDRTAFVEYAGASGDFTPLHFDDPFARSCGFESVFAQGMLIAGIASRLVTDRFGVGNVRAFRTQFEDQVWPDETVVAYGSVAEKREGGGERLADYAFEARTADGRLVLTGEATAAV